MLRKSRWRFDSEFELHLKIAFIYLHKNTDIKQNPKLKNLNLNFFIQKLQYIMLLKTVRSVVYKKQDYKHIFFYCS